MFQRSIAAPAFVGLLLALACTSSEEAKNNKAADLPPVVAPLPPFQGTAYQAAAGVKLPKTEPEEHPELHNVFELSGDIVSGSEPHGEEAFRILASKGIRTILSVDGKTPDAELAAQYGMKYVHVPIQYKGINEEEVAKLAKTFREQEGPFFVHCFHGKHRGPAAAEIGRLVLDGIPRETALAEMRQCGTAETYEGLYSTVAHARIPSAEETRAMQWDFPAASPLDGMAGAMVQMARADDNLKALSKTEWKLDPAHPDIDPLNEATKLADLFSRASALPEVATRPADFRQWMEDSKAQSIELRDVLAAMKKGSGSGEDATKAYKTLAKTCTACHDLYRN